jgi:hypothetical protein
MGIVEAISNGFRAVAEVFGWAKSRSETKNKENVQQAAQAKQAAERKADIEKAVQNEDVEATRRNIS